MDSLEGAEAYARADFSEVNASFVSRFMEEHPAAGPRRVVDLGCGPAGIPIRLARAELGCRVTAVDASPAMLALARRALESAGLSGRIALLEGRVPDLALEAGSFDAVISNSLLHHLPDPAVFWSEVLRLGRPGAALFVMDLFRPASEEAARRIVEEASSDEPPRLKEDFHNSLLAAFTPAEVSAQLSDAGLRDLSAEVISERHWLVSGGLTG